MVYFCKNTLGFFVKFCKNLNFKERRLFTKQTRVMHDHFRIPHFLFKMAAEERVSPFPLPPSDYYKLYTDENIKGGIVPEPPPPIRGEYTVFGLHFEVFVTI